MATQKTTVYDLAKKYVEAVEWVEAHPDDPYAQDAVDLAEERLTEAITPY